MKNLLIIFLLIVTCFSFTAYAVTIQGVVGEAINETGIKWNPVSDVGNRIANLTSGVQACGLLIHNGTAWEAATGSGGIINTGSSGGGLPETNLLTLLSNATAVGVGNSFELTPTDGGNNRLFSKLTWQVLTFNSPSSLLANLEGSINNTDWFAIDNSTTTTKEMRHVVNKPIKFIRARIVSLTGSGGQAVTIQSIHGGN